MHLTWSKVYVEIAARKILRVSCLKFWIKQSRFGKLCCLVNLGIWNIYQISNWFDLSKFCTENLAANIFFRFSSVDISPLSHIFKPDFFLRLKWTNSFIKQNEENQWFEFWQILYGKPRSLSPLKMCFGFPLCTAHHLPNRKSSFSSKMDWKPFMKQNE